MKKTRRSSHVTLLAVNIKLRSTHRKGSDAYSELLQHVFEKKLIGTPKRGNSIILRTQFSQSINEHKIIYGKISRFTKLDSNDWIDLDKMEIAKYELPQDMFPNLKETDYYFIPETHRLFIKKSSSLSILQVEDFLKKVLPKCLKPGEEYEVSIEQDHDTIQRILDSTTIRRIELEISYTNNDFKDESEEYVENILKEMQASSTKMVMSPDQHAHLSMKNKFLRGAVKLAKSNGYVKANILDANNKPEQIITKDHPETYRIEILNKDSVLKDIIDFMIKQFKRNASKS